MLVDFANQVISKVFTYALEWQKHPILFDRVENLYEKT